MLSSGMLLLFSGSGKKQNRGALMKKNNFNKAFNPVNNYSLLSCRVVYNACICGGRRVWNTRYI